eukprot:1161614-Pelagomonas_calceolata.AAC.3
MEACEQSAGCIKKGIGGTGVCASKAQNASEERWRRTECIRGKVEACEQGAGCIRIGTGGRGVCASNAQSASEDRWRRVSKVQDAPG